VKVYESFSNDKTKVLVTEYCSDSTLEKYIKEKGRLQEKEAVDILEQILFGLIVTHSLFSNSIGTVSSTKTLNPQIYSFTRESSKYQSWASLKSCLLRNKMPATLF